MDDLEHAQKMSRDKSGRLGQMIEEARDLRAQLAQADRSQAMLADHLAVCRQELVTASERLAAMTQERDEFQRLFLNRGFDAKQAEAERAQAVAEGAITLRLLTDAYYRTSGWWLALKPIVLEDAAPLAAEHLRQDARMREALEWIAHFSRHDLDDARTLHYDMNGVAMKALAAAPLAAEHLRMDAELRERIAALETHLRRYHPKDTAAACDILAGRESLPMPDDIEADAPPQARAEGQEASDD